MRNALARRCRSLIDRAARISFAFLVLNYSAAVALPALLLRKRVWRRS
jgi:hypothetical protein